FGLLAVLALSTLLCTLTRLKLTRQRLFQRLDYLSPREILSLPVRVELDPTKVLLKRDTGWQSRTFDDGLVTHFRPVGRLALIGGALIHVGLLILLAGGLWSRTVYVETAIHGMEGERVALPTIEALQAGAQADRYRRQVRAAQSFNASDARMVALAAEIDRLDSIYKQGVMQPAFKISFDRLWVDVHEVASASDLPMTRNWNTQGTVQQADQVVASAVIRVNEPFSYGGLSFYQADWKKVYREVRLKGVPIGEEGIRYLGSQPIELIASLGAPISLENSSYTIVVLDFWPDFRFMGAEPVSVSDELRNPSARLAIYDGEGKLAGRAWAFGEELEELSGHLSNLPVRFLVTGAAPRFESVLQVAADPAIPVVWLGSLIMTLGMFLTLYVSYREEWMVEQTNGKVLLAVNGNRAPFLLLESLRSLLQRVAPEATLPEDLLRERSDT
ncbi:MAG TPA: cytochrome c biogenesis protein ResB, partial [Candidatus Ozemobacteraceae bacterium]|nr:cytochrome c biogenesis protein ResB [Candidatus Ozemobacteraceae bacterium]